MNNLRTAKQQEILSKLTQTFGIDEQRILFLNPRDENEPWIPSDELMSIARQNGGFKQVSVTHDKFIPETAQVLYTAIVVDEKDRSFIRSGAATLGEKPNGIELDAETLASGRALNAALRDAGFHPFRSGSVVNFDEAKQEIEAKREEEKNFAIEDEAQLRTKDLRQIHAVANEKGLIIELEGGVKDMTKYRRELYKNFGTNTAATLNRTERAAVINWLKKYDGFLAEIPQELQNDAMVA